MTRRRGSHAVSGSIESLLSRLPERFWHPTPVVEDGQLVGLQDYLGDLEEHLRKQLAMRPVTDLRSVREQPPVAEVMAAIDCSPAKWYQAVL